MPQKNRTNKQSRNYLKPPQARLVTPSGELEKSTKRESPVTIIVSIIAMVFSGFAVYYARQQSNVSKDALAQQLGSYKMQLLLEKPILKLDSVYCLTQTNGATWNFAFNFSNTGRRPFKVKKGIFYIVNPDKDFMAGAISYSGDIKYTQEGFADVIKRSIPDSIMSDLSTTLLMQISYEDPYVNSNEVFLHNFTWEGRHHHTGNLLLSTKESPGLIDGLKNFINKKEGEDVFAETH